MQSILLLLLLINPLVHAESNNSLVLSSNNIDILVSWEPIEVKPNELVTFKLIFMENDTKINVNYDFIVLKEDIMIKEVKNSFAMDGEATHIVEFPSSGSFTVIINMLDSRDSVTFDLKVTPEFPIGMTIVAVTLIGITIALTRLTIMNKNKHIN